MKLIRLFFTLLVLANGAYLLFLFSNSNMLADYLWLLQDLASISPQDLTEPVNLGTAALLLVESGIIVFLWLAILILIWSWRTLALLFASTTISNELMMETPLQLAAKPASMTDKLYEKYKEAAAVSATSKAGSILLLRSFLEAMIHECFHLKKSNFFNSIGKLRKAGQITKEEAKLLHRLRKMGNITSHQRELSSQDIRTEDMNRIFECTNQLMLDWYGRKRYGQALIEKRYKPRKPKVEKTSTEEDIHPPVGITASTAETDSRNQLE